MCNNTYITKAKKKCVNVCTLYFFAVRWSVCKCNVYRALCNKNSVVGKSPNNKIDNVNK